MRAWIKWIEPEVGVVVMECDGCHYHLVTLDPPDRCPECGDCKNQIVRGEDGDHD